MDQSKWKKSKRLKEKQNERNRQTGKEVEKSTTNRPASVCELRPSKDA